MHSSLLSAFQLSQILLFDLVYYSALATNFIRKGLFSSWFWRFEDMMPDLTQCDEGLMADGNGGHMCWSGHRNWRREGDGQG
jgi:hypothetical protein